MDQNNARLSINTNIEEEQPHSAPFFSLLYNTASNLLSHVVTVEPRQSSDNQTPISQVSNTESLVSFIYDLAGFPNDEETSSSTVETNNERIERGEPVERAQIHVPNLKKRQSIFSEEELSEFAFPAIENEMLATQKMNENIYLPSREEEVQHDAPSLNLEIFKQLHTYLPALLREASKIDLLYSVERDGISMNTLYNKTKDQGPCIIAIKDVLGNLFGAFASESLNLRSGYYGNGTTFLWKQHNGNIQAFQATGKNDYYILSEANCIAFGGGDGKFGLWIDNELYHGHSETCATFNNDLLSTNTEYEINSLEIWGFQL